MTRVALFQLQKAADVAKYQGLEKFCCVQQQYNLMVRDIEWEVTDVCKNEGIGLLPWSPLKGFSQKNIKSKKFKNRLY